MRFLLSTLLVTTSILVSQQAIAAPELHGNVNIEIEDALAYRADNDDVERNVARAKVEPYLILQLNKNWAVETSLAFERQQSFEPGEHVWFDNNGLAAEEIKLTYNEDWYGAVLGKFNPAFGYAWGNSSGFWGDDFADDYETVEKIGLGGHVNFGQNRLSVAAFMPDTSIFSDTLITRRDRTRYDDGGAGNTHGLNSYTAQLDSKNVGGIEGLGLHIGYRQQQEGDNDPDGQRERALSLGAGYETALTPRWDMELMGEYAGFDNHETSTDDATYLTTGVTFTLDKHWLFSSGFGSRDFDNDGRDVLGHGTLGYKFDNGIKLEGGYLYREENKDSQDAIGGRLKYGYEF